MGIKFRTSDSQCLSFQKEIPHWQKLNNRQPKVNPNLVKIRTEDLTNAFTQDPQPLQMSSLIFTIVRFIMIPFILCKNTLQKILIFVTFVTHNKIFIPKFAHYGKWYI